MSVQENGAELLILMGSKLKEKRTELNFSTAELARKTNISEFLLCEIEEGRRGMSVEIFFEIKKALCVSFGYLFGEE